MVGIRIAATLSGFFGLMVIMVIYKSRYFHFEAIINLAKVSDWNSFRTNPKFSESLRNSYPHQTVSFRYNPKKFFNPINPRPIKNQSDFIIRWLWNEINRVTWTQSGPITSFYKC